MGLLKVTDRITKSSHPGDLTSELEKVRRELHKVRRHNDSLVSQVNNLLHFINEQNRRKRNLQHRITINPKTGLPNHNKMDQDMQSFFASFMENPEQRPGAVILIKLDSNYDIITKTLKPSVSEWIVYQISTRLKELVTDATPLYHTRDDEFIMMIADKGDPKSLKPLVQDISTEVAKPHIFSGYHITIECIIGISFFPENGSNKSSILNNADIALTYAKKNNKKFVFFTDHMRDEVVRRMELQNSIIKALEEQSIKEIDKQFFLQMQPIMTINGFESGQPLIEQMDAEALIRWHHPDKGIITPDTFIPIAEETGLIIIIGKWVLYMATAIIESWSKKDSVYSHLAINVSPRQFNNDDLIDSIQRIISFKSINPEMLQVEITENSFLDDPEEAVRKITKLKDLGIRIAIDDFGTGFSSVNYLRKLPVDVVKIDRSFITDIIENQQDRSIVKAMIAMTSELGMENVVEGVETQEQLELLIKFGIRRFQGFYFSKPLNPADYLSLYRETFSGRE
ncbi:MAG: bifunctional diguanylate cyclase/phosphodiesterase [Spirochaetaceae bacterium]|nr:bifunctional diguanylate cyclase/phosphodiesterase [Spirochaetaceae bacterium]